MTWAAVKGGIAQMKKESPSPGVDFRISAAGPAVSLLIALVAGGIVAAGSAAGEFGKTVGLAHGAGTHAMGGHINGWQQIIPKHPVVIELLKIEPAARRYRHQSTRQLVSMPVG